MNILISFLENYANVDHATVAVSVWFGCYKIIFLIQSHSVTLQILTL